MPGLTTRFATLPSGLMFSATWSLGSSQSIGGRWFGGVGGIAIMSSQFSLQIQDLPLLVLNLLLFVLNLLLLVGNLPLKLLVVAPDPFQLAL
jgi:hypothetical protein